jgi:hypothetical protein
MQDRLDDIRKMLIEKFDFLKEGSDEFVTKGHAKYTDAKKEMENAGSNF